MASLANYTETLNKRFNINLKLQKSEEEKLSNSFYKARNYSDTKIRKKYYYKKKNPKQQQKQKKKKNKNKSKKQNKNEQKKS